MKQVISHDLYFITCNLDRVFRGKIRVWSGLPVKQSSKKSVQIKLLIIYWWWINKNRDQSNPINSDDKWPVKRIKLSSQAKPNEDQWIIKGYWRLICGCKAAVKIIIVGDFNSHWPKYSSNYDYWTFSKTFEAVIVLDQRGFWLNRFGPWKVVLVLAIQCFFKTIATGPLAIHCKLLLSTKSWEFTIYCSWARKKGETLCAQIEEEVEIVLFHVIWIIWWKFFLSAILLFVETNTWKRHYWN